MFRQLIESIFKNESFLQKKANGDEFNNIPSEIKKYSMVTGASIQDTQNFVDKAAMWFQLKYSSERIRSMFSNESYKPTIFDNMSLEDFSNTLSESEKRFLQTPYIVDGYVDGKKLKHLCISVYSRKGQYLEISFDLSEKGYITGTDHVEFKKYIGHYFEELLYLLENDNYILDKYSRDFIIKSQGKYEELLEATKGLYRRIADRIVEWDPTYEGLIRAIEFTKSFGYSNVLLTLYLFNKYGVPDYCGKLVARVILNEYIKIFSQKIHIEGILNLPVKYGNRTVIIGDLLRTLDVNTPEEDELHKRLASAILSKVDMSELSKYAEEERKEEIKRFRIERKIEKSKTK